MDERWLPVVGYEGLYEVSDAGGIRSIDRMKPHRWGGESLVAGRDLAHFPDKDGYRKVTLHRAGRMTQHRLHRLVLLAFVGECPAGEQALHSDDTPGNNALANLSWGTPKRNMEARDAHGGGPQGARNPKAKLTRVDVAAIRADRRTQVKIAADRGIDQTTVSNIKVRRTWAHVA